MSALPVGDRTDCLRRELGPNAWCALECLAERADARGVAVASVRSLAIQLGVAKNTAHRALTTLVRAGLVEAVQDRGTDGQFRPGVYRLHLDLTNPTRQAHRCPIDCRSGTTQPPPPKLTHAPQHSQPPNPSARQTSARERELEGAVLRVTTLHANTAGPTARYYTHYLADDGPEGEWQWLGRQAAGLALAGSVSTDDLEALLSGHDPVTGTRLGNPLVDRWDAKGNLIPAVAGFDATFSSTPRCRPR